MPTRGLQVVITGDPRGFEAALKRAAGATVRFGQQTKTAGQKIEGTGRAVTKGLTVPIVALGAGAVKLAADFEKGMDGVQAATQAPAKAMDRLRQQALKAGQDTAYSAREAAQAQAELGKGGIAAGQILKGALGGALSLAAAGQVELSEAASTTANALNLFGLEGDKAGHIADVFAQSANMTTADVTDFGMALRQVGGVAKTAGYTFDETMVGLEALAAAGVKNSDAGTSMKAAIQQLLGPSKKQLDLQKELGVSFVDSNGKMKGTADIATMLRGKLGDMGEAQRLATLKTLAGADGVRFLTSLYDAGAPKINAFAKANEKAGVAADVARTKQGNLAGKVEQLKGSLETLGIVVGTALIPPLTDLAQKATAVFTDIADAFSSLPPEGQKAVLVFVGIVAAIGPVMAIAGRLVTAFSAVRGALALLPGGGILAAAAAFGLLTDNSRILEAALGGLAGAAIGALVGKIAAMVGPMFAAAGAMTKAGGAANIAAAGMTRLKAAFATNPIGLVLTALGTAAGALGLFSSGMDKAKTSAQGLADALLGVRTATDNMADADLTAKEKALAVTDAQLALRTAIAQRTAVMKNGKSTALDQANADQQVRRATVQLERAQRDQVRTTRDASTQRRKDTAAANENIGVLKKHVNELKFEQVMLQAKNASQSEVAANSRKLKAAEAELAAEQARLSGALRESGGAAQKAGATIGAARSGPDLLRAGMILLGDVHVDMSGFTSSIVGGLSAAMNAATDWVGRIRDKLAQASPNKKGSPAPNDVIADGFGEMRDVVIRGYRDVNAAAADGTRGFRAATLGALYPLDKQINDAAAKLEELRATFDRNDRAAEMRSTKRVADRSKKSTSGLKDNELSQARAYNDKIDEARKRLAELRKEASRTRKESKIEVQIAGLERVRDFTNAIASIRKNLSDLAASAAESFKTIREQARQTILDATLKDIDNTLKAALAAIDSGPLAAELAKLQAEDDAEQRAQEDADAEQKIADAKGAAGTAAANTALAEQYLQAVRASGSASAIAAAEAQYAATVEAQKAADAAVIAAEAEKNRLIRTRREAELAKQIEDLKATAEAEAKINGEAAQAKYDAQAAQDQKDLEQFQAALTAKLTAEADQLAQRTQNYAQFAADVAAILAPLGLVLPTSPEEETTIDKPKRKKKKKKKATGGRVYDPYGELTRVGELGPEDVYLPRGAVVTQASQSRGGDSAPAIGELNIYPQGAAGDDAEALAALIGFQVSSRR